MNLRTHSVAKTAYARVMAHKDAESYKKRYGALAHKFPGMLLQNGLAQATGFLLAKASDERPEHLLLLNDIAMVLSTADATDELDASSFHQHVIGADLRRTMVLTRKVLEASGWMKRYVQGALGVDATGASTADDDRQQDENEQ